MHENAISRDSHAALYDRVKQRLNKGEEEQQALLARVSEMVIRDKLAAPTGMHFLRKGVGELGIYYGAKVDPPDLAPAAAFTIHRHALAQLVQKVNVPIFYANSLLSRQAEEQWKTELLADILEESYQNTKFQDRSGSPRFLHRLVGNELRGFLSRRFNRHIASAPLLRSFVETCTQVGAFPFDATAADTKIALKCMLPDIFEPVKGQFVCIGVEWSNSDFGAGRMQVALSVWMPKGDRFTVLDHIVSRVHIGSVIEESDIEMSEETAKAEAEVQCLAIRDSVKGQLSVDSVNRLLTAIDDAHKKEIPWDKLKGQLIFLPKIDVTTLQQVLQEGHADLPPVPRNAEGQNVPTRWWASAALAWLASETHDPEKRLELEHKAGAFLDVA